MVTSAVAVSAGMTVADLITQLKAYPVDAEVTLVEMGASGDPNDFTLDDPSFDLDESINVVFISRTVECTCDQDDEWMSWVGVAREKDGTERGH